MNVSDRGVMKRIYNNTELYARLFFCIDTNAYTLMNNPNDHLQITDSPRLSTINLVVL